MLQETISKSGRRQPALYRTAHIAMPNSFAATFPSKDRLNCLYPTADDPQLSPPYLPDQGGETDPAHSLLARSVPRIKNLTGPVMSEVHGFALDFLLKKQFDGDFKNFHYMQIFLQNFNGKSGLGSFLVHNTFLEFHGKTALQHSPEQLR